MKAMIFAAGMGTRLKPLTDSIPKALIPVGGIPLLEHVILKVKAAGFSDIIINVHHFHNQIIDFLQTKNNFDINIAISDERNQLLETGGGLKKAQWFLDDKAPFLVHNVDILSNVDLKTLYEQHLQNAALATLVVSQRESMRYFLFDEQHNLKGWIHEKTGETKPNHIDNISDLQKLAFSGIQIISNEVFQLMQNFPYKFSITDFYLNLAESQTIKAFIPQNYQMMDVGKLETLDQAEQFVRNLKC